MLAKASGVIGVIVDQVSSYKKSCISIFDLVSQFLVLKLTITTIKTNYNVNLKL